MTDRLTLKFTAPGTDGKATFIAVSRRFTGPNMLAFLDVLQGHQDALSTLAREYVAVAAKSLQAVPTTAGKGKKSKSATDPAIEAKELEREGIRQQLRALYDVIRFVVDLDASKLTDEQRGWLESDHESEFWNCQDLHYLRSVKRDFTARVSLKDSIN